MVRGRQTPGQVVRELREADRMVAEGSDTAAVARHLKASVQTLHPPPRDVHRRWTDQPPLS